MYITVFETKLSRDILYFRAISLGGGIEESDLRAHSALSLEREENFFSRNAETFVSTATYLMRTTA